MWFVGRTAFGVALLAALGSIQNVYFSSASGTGVFQHRYHHGNKLYVYFSKPLTYEIARQVCRAGGGQLATIRDAGTNEFIAKLRARVNFGGYRVRIKGWGIRPDNELPVSSGLSIDLPTRGESSAAQGRCPYLSLDQHLDWDDAECVKTLWYSSRTPMSYICQYENGGELRSNDTLACMQNGGPCFELVHSANKKVDGESGCEERGGSLALIDTKETHDFLKSIIHLKWKCLNVTGSAPTTPGVKTWAGVQTSPLRWEHVDGSPLEYTNWAPGEPGDPETNSCAPFTEGRWYTTQCDFDVYCPYICEYPKETSPDSTYCLDDTCYVVTKKQQLTPGQAHANCRKKGGNLAMPKSATINALLNTILQKIGGKATWLGIHAVQRFVYSDGTPLTFSAWYNSDMEDYATTVQQQVCVIIDDFHKWYDTQCSEENTFVCEYEASNNSGVEETHWTVAPGEPRVSISLGPLLRHLRVPLKNISNGNIC